MTLSKYEQSSAMNKDKLLALLGEILSRRDERVIVTVTEKGEK